MEQFNFLKIDDEIFKKHYKYYYHLIRHLNIIKEYKITTRRDLLKYFEQYNFINDWIKLKDYLIEEIENIILNERKLNKRWFFSNNYLIELKEFYKTTNYNIFISQINQFEFIMLIKQLLLLKMANYGIFDETEFNLIKNF